jgi:hypothetical protein
MTAISPGDQCCLAGADFACPRLAEALLPARLVPAGAPFALPLAAVALAGAPFAGAPFAGAPFALPLAAVALAVVLAGAGLAARRPFRRGELAPAAWFALGFFRLSRLASEGGATWISSTSTCSGLLAGASSECTASASGVAIRGSVRSEKLISGSSTSGGFTRRGAKGAEPTAGASGAAGLACWRAA